jgi:hypothetical protein
VREPEQVIHTDFTDSHRFPKKSREAKAREATTAGLVPPS